MRTGRGQDPWQVDAYDLETYLDTVGEPAGPVDRDTLTRLCSAHMAAFPFANVDVLLGTHPGVGPEAVNTQLLDRGRGGYCFEQVQLFAGVLARLGFDVRRALGRVHSVESRRTHMTVEVHLQGRRWLCDPGFGFSLTGPIELVDGARRSEGGRTWSVHQRDDQGSVVWELARDGEPMHFTDELTVHPSDVHMGHFATSRSPDSHFTRRLLVARFLDGRHVTLTSDHRSIRIPGRDTVREELDVDEVVQTVTELGVRLVDDEPDRLAELVRASREEP